MSTVTTGRDGIEYVHTNVLVPSHLRDFARNERISMSKLLRQALQEEIERRGNGQ